MKRFKNFALLNPPVRLDSSYANAGGVYNNPTTPLLKRLRNISAGFMSLVMLTCVGMSQVSAANSDVINSGSAGSNTASHDVKLGTPKLTADPVYHVDVTWGNLIYNYTVAWDPDTLENTYTWTPQDTGNDKITITNKSNIAINATLKFTANSNAGPAGQDYSAINGSFFKDSGHQQGLQNSTVTLAAASDGIPTTGDAYMSLRGRPTNPEAGDIIGTVTVTVTEQS